MMKKAEFIELVIETLSGGAAPDNRKFHPNVVGKFVDLAINSVIATMAREGLSTGNYNIDNGFIKSFNKVRVRWDQIRGQCYINFPARPILLDYNRGVREIGFPLQDGSPTFLINDASSWQVLSALEVSVLPAGQFIALVEGDRVYFPDMNEIFKGTNLLVKMICGVQGYKDDEDIPLEESKAMDIAMMVVNLMGTQKQIGIKVVNNTNPNTI